MKKAYKKGQLVKVISTFISENNPENITAEIMFCNNQSLLIRFNQELFEVPEKAIICVVDSPLKQEPIVSKIVTPKKTVNKNQSKKQIVRKGNLTKNTIVKPEKSSTKNKKPKRYGHVTTPLVYIPPKTNYYECRSTRKNEVSYGAAHDRAYWALTHPFVGGCCTPR